MNKTSIMIVEDEHLIALDIKKSLEDMGYGITSISARASEALKHLEEEKMPDLVLMDINLRGKIDGIEAASDIHDRYGIPVIFLTAFADSNLVERACKVGSYGYMIKPIDNRQLCAMIEVALSRYRADMDRHLLDERVQRESCARHIAERKKVEEKLGNRSRGLRERVKELNCFYGISRLLERPGIVLNDFLRNIVHIIPPSWQYPKIACARLLIDGKEYRTKNFTDTVWKQSCDIVVRNKIVGVLDVCYLEERAECDEGPFLKEERSLINAVAERVGRVCELKQNEKMLRAKSKEVYETNTALNVLLKKRDEELTELEEKVHLNIRMHVSPFLARLKEDGLNEKQYVCIKTLEKNLLNIVKSISHNSVHIYHKLTPSEIFIADYIKEGKKTAEMAKLLNVSPRTIDFHRRNIRRKLDIKSKKENLRSCLLNQK